jgi:hypothetical protein
MKEIPHPLPPTIQRARGFGMTRRWGVMGKRGPGGKVIRCTSKIFCPSIPASLRLTKDCHSEPHCKGRGGGVVRNLLIVRER